MGAAILRHIEGINKFDDSAFVLRTHKELDLTDL